MSSITPAEIKKQFNRVKAAGWLRWFEQAAEKAGTTTSHFLAIGSRETNLKNIKGDFRNGKWNGFGVMQVDVGTDPEYARTWAADKVEPGIRRGGEIYQSKVDQIVEGKRLSVRGKKFTGKAVEPDDVRRIATAGYNSGLWGYYNFSTGKHIDAVTTGKDYSRDVYDRAVEFADLLGELKEEVELQGKYARAKHQKRAGLKETPDIDEPTPGIEPIEPEPAKPESGAPAPAPAPIEPKGDSQSKVSVQKVAQSVGSKFMASGTMLTGILTAIGAAFMGIINNPFAFTLLILGVIAAAVYLWNESKKRQLQLQLDLNAKAASQQMNTVVVKPPAEN